MDTTKTISLVTVILLLISGVTYTVIKTNTEQVCKTGQGWTVVSTHSTSDGKLLYKSECRYLTKPVVSTYCLSFRSTVSYPRYGCEEVKLVEVPKYVLKPLTPDQGADEMMYNYNGNKYYCKKDIGCVMI